VGSAVVVLPVIAQERKKKKYYDAVESTLRREGQMSSLWGILGITERFLRNDDGKSDVKSRNPRCSFTVVRFDCFLKGTRSDVSGA
jgi:hypothetical protein